MKLDLVKIVIFSLLISQISILTISATSTSTQITFEQIAHITLPETIFLDCEIIDDVLFIMTVSNGLITYNVSNIQNPIQLATYQEPCYAHHFDIQGDYYFLADNALGMKIINITNPSNLQKTGVYLPEGDGEITGVHANGNYLYAAEWHDSLSGFKMLVLDISNKTNPVKIAEYNDEDHNFIRFQTEDDLCYVSCNSDGFKILNVSNPLAISEISHYSNMEDAFNFQIIDNRAFIADGSNFQILDIEDITAITKIGNYSTSNFVLDVEILDSIALISERGKGLEALDISTPQNPILLEEISTPDMFGIDVNGQYLYTALFEYGLKIFKYNITILTTNAFFPDIFKIITFLGISVYLSKFLKKSKVVN
ncbi:MAG: LVIVD repeat-containing protein [Candidatus Thorarchaeota archaeon]